ncbi:leucine-rich repeat protein [Mycoplasma sp. 005V]|uniref:leucine-rich repeat protein n=1 Tax=unclassified Mycoplasma TaxID=2683645 RepID=UPI003A847FE9
MKRNKVLFLLGLLSTSAISLPLVAISCGGNKATEQQPKPIPGTSEPKPTPGNDETKNPALITLKSQNPAIKIEFNKDTKVLSVKNAPIIDFDLLNDFLQQLDEMFDNKVGNITLECPDTKTIAVGYPYVTSVKVTKLIMPKLESTTDHVFRLWNPERDWLFKNLQDDKVVQNGVLIKWDNAIGNLVDNNITKILQYAFMDTQNITGIDFPKLNDIEATAFMGTNGDIFPKITEKLVVNGILIKYPGAKGEIKDDSIKQIYAYVFKGNTSITSVSFPNATKLYYGAFLDASNLAKVDLPKLDNIGNFAFENCTSLTSVSFPKVTAVGEYAFSNCKNLSSVELPLVSSMDKVPFDATPKLPEKLIFNKILAKWSNAEGEVSDLEVTQLVPELFRNNNKITSANFPNVTKISSWLFAKATELKNATFEKATIIDSSAFKEAESLVQIQAPNVTKIAAEGFSGAVSLVSVSFPNVTEIGERAFANDISLKQADFPKATIIAHTAFVGTDNLTDKPSAQKN